MALARCNSFDEDVCDCFAGALPTRVTKVGGFMLKRFKIDLKGYPKLSAWSQKGAKSESK